ncbi:MAG: phage tail protein [Myxococcales bacterium]|nr:phage tail protein [Myxococcales bacterium]
MANNDTRPLPVFCFRVNLDIPGFDVNKDAIFFKSVSGLRYETEVVDVKAGGVNNSTFRLVGATKWANLVFKQGFTASSKLLEWRNKWLAGSGSRASGSIELMDSAGKSQRTWRFVDGWPCKWEISEFDASKTELAIETLEIAHHGLS